jgi:uncharacterized protein (DUF1330 family)
MLPPVFTVDSGGTLNLSSLLTKEAVMPAYVIVQEVVIDESKFNLYREQVMPTLAEHGGRFIIRGGDVHVLEGKLPYPRLVVLEFPNRESIDAWYNSSEYQRIMPLRRDSCEGNLVVVDGIEQPRQC